jgi:hypothetical protein
MSEPVECDRCGAVGRRRRFRIAPDGWLYAEFKDLTSGETYYAYACSPACAVVEWKAGPGDMRDDGRGLPATSGGHVSGESGGHECQ